jgi:hypothetical protein
MVAAIAIIGHIAWQERRATEGQQRWIRPQQHAARQQGSPVQQPLPTTIPLLPSPQSMVDSRATVPQGPMRLRGQPAAPIATGGRPATSAVPAMPITVNCLWYATGNGNEKRCRRPGCNNRLLTDYPPERCYATCQAVESNRRLNNQSHLASSAAIPRVTYDKSLGPDGKPWTGASLIQYWKSRRPELDFTIVNRLELEVGAIKRLQEGNGLKQPKISEASFAPAKLTGKEAVKARRERELANRRKVRAIPKAKSKAAKSLRTVVYSETPARTELIEKVCTDFKIDEPDRAIVDFAGSREAAYGDLKRRGYSIDDDPALHFNDRESQRLYWIDAVEILDFLGNEEAAKAYYEEFDKQNNGCSSIRWHRVVVTGDMGLLHDIIAILNGGSTYEWNLDGKMIVGPIVPQWKLQGETRKRLEEGKRGLVNVDGYKGFPISITP